MDNLYYQSDSVIYFQRFSVIISEFLLLYVTYLYIHSFKTQISTQTKVIVYLFVSLHAGLLIIDHIHFQYNNLIISVLFLCFYSINIGNYWLLAIFYSILVCLKHLFLPLAPIFAIFLLKNYCFQSKYMFKRLLILIFIAITILCITFLPIIISAIYYSKVIGNSYENSFEKLFQNSIEIIKIQLIQIFQRLFPFGRGLLHTYWAPNVWALYTLIDKLLYKIFNQLLLKFLTKIEFLLQNMSFYTLKLSILTQKYSFFTEKLQFLTQKVEISHSNVIIDSFSGKTGIFLFHILPNITPLICIILYLLLIIYPIIIIIKMNKIIIINNNNFIKIIIYCFISFFMIGYHLHEKYLLLPLICQLLLLLNNKLSNNQSNNQTNNETNNQSNNQTNNQLNNNNIETNYHLIKHQQCLAVSNELLLLLTQIGLFQLFPLLFTLQELFTKCMLF